MKKSRKIYIIAICIIVVVALTLIGAWLRIGNLGEVNFQNDEYYHVDASFGYLVTGNFELWDFSEEKTIAPYSRAWPYTWLVAQSFNLFGVSEWSARLPSVFFGILLLPLIFLLAWKISKSRIVGIFSLLLVTFDSSFIWSARVCRMYSMFVFFVLVASWLIYKGLNNKKKWFDLYYLIPGIVIWLFSYIIHEAALLLVLGYLMYFLINIKQHKKYLILSGILMGGGLIFLLINYFATPLMSAEFITIRLQPNWEYFYYPFNQLRTVYLGWFMVALGGLLLWQKKSDIKLYYLSLFLPIVLFFVFFADRYAAKKYMLFIVPFILIFYTDSFYNVFKKIANNKLLYPSLIVVFLFVGPLFSWPGVEPNVFFQQARADQNYSNFALHDYENAYAYIEENYKPSEPILILQNRGYYFSRKDLNFITLQKDKKYKEKDLIKLFNDNDSGWVVWPKYKQDLHLNKKLVKYCEKNFKFTKEIKNTNIKVYRWQKSLETFN